MVKDSQLKSLVLMHIYIYYIYIYGFNTDAGPKTKVSGDMLKRKIPNNDRPVQKESKRYCNSLLYMNPGMVLNHFQTARPKVAKPPRDQEHFVQYPLLATL